MIQCGAPATNNISKIENQNQVEVARVKSHNLFELKTPLPPPSTLALFTKNHNSHKIFSRLEKTVIALKLTDYSSYSNPSLLYVSGFVEETEELSFSRLTLLCCRSFHSFHDSLFSVSYVSLMNYTPTPPNPPFPGGEEFSAKKRGYFGVPQKELPFYEVSTNGVLERSVSCVCDCTPRNVVCQHGSKNF